MRIASLELHDSMPVRQFDLNEVADVIVVAGPNGVGKSRLLAHAIQVLRGDAHGTPSSAVIEATSKVEVEGWGKPTLDLSDAEDVSIYRTMLQANRARRNMTSSLLQFESNRAVTNVQPLQFAWDMADPTDEMVGWDFGFNFWSSRWQDTVHSLFRMIEHQKQSIATRAVQLRREGHEEMKLSFLDPMEPFKRVFAQLLGPKELVDPAARRQTLEFKDGNNVFDISSLSSGEREVVNVAFDFMLRNPRDCIVVFDEPELHLHPELSHRLIQTLQGIGERNQFILSTHSPDIISRSLDQTVVFVSPTGPEPEEGTWPNQALLVSDDDETNQALKLLGHSIGIISLGRKIVLVEGTTSSLDKETYGSVLAGRFPELVLVPSGGKHILESFDTIRAAVLEKSLWGVEFYMLSDRDSAPLGSPADDSNNQFRRLDRYHLENYFLDPTTIARAFAEIEGDESWLRDPIQIREKLREVARGLVSYATALAVSSEVRLDVGNVDVMAKNCHGLDQAALAALVVSKAGVESARIGQALDDTQVQGLVATVYTALTASLDGDTEVWLNEIPGKPLLAQFIAVAGIQQSRFKRLYLRAAERVDDNPFEPVIEIFTHFAND